MAKSTIITTNTTALSRAADAIHAQGEKPSKNRILNALSASIAGPGKDWGFLKNAPDGHFVQSGLGAPTAAAETAQSSLYVVVMDEREDWARTPEVYVSREELAQGIRETYPDLLREIDLPLSEAVEKVIDDRGLSLPADTQAYEECENPANLTIYEYKIDVPANRASAWVLEIDNKDDWGSSARLFASKHAALAAFAKQRKLYSADKHLDFDEMMHALAKTGEFDSTPQDDVTDDDDEDEWFERHDSALMVTIREVPIEGMEISPDEIKPQPAQPSPVEMQKCQTLYHPDLDGGEDQGLKFGGIFFEDRNHAEEWAKTHDLDQSDPEWRDGLIALRDCQIEAEFLPQIWDGDDAREITPVETKEWEVLPHEVQPKGYFSDYLKTSQNAPAWVRDWGGPFEIYLAVTTPDAKSD